MSQRAESGVVAFVVLAALIGVVALALLLWDESEAVRNFAILASLAIAVPVGLWRILVAARQASAAERSATAGASAAETSRREALDAQLRAGAAMIADQNPGARAAGGYLLKRLAEEHADDYNDVVAAVLAAVLANREGSDDAGH